ncbi:unnamed protein product [Orchesella dallaii]|uniref:Pyridine nucleotide-disulfide oxidoreductase domain-containing protein 1 n=1 Tax=Orchesella dallaii TaxID=48710 RepID=A0ABP1RRB6_9HEXA
MEPEECVTGRYTFAVIGGGIAGVSCVEQILEFDPEASILLISSSPVVKVATQVTRLSKTLEDFIVLEKPLKSFKDVHQSVRVVHGVVAELLPEQHLVITKAGEKFQYKKVCICAGASPKVLFPGWEHVVGIRDTESVAQLAQRISKARKVLLLGNGGIATEFVHEVTGVDIVWAIKDKSISAHFVDPGAAEFFIQSKLSNINASQPGDTASPNISTSCDPCEHVSTSASTSGEGVAVTSVQTTELDSDTTSKNLPSKRRKYTISSILPDSGKESQKQDSFGSALGPDWHQNVNLKGQNLLKNVEILYEKECVGIRTNESTGADMWPVLAELNDGSVIGCDLVVSATGVSPNCSLFKYCEQEIEKGIFTDDAMRTSVKDVYAAGDVCFPNWTWSKHWFQMRLWTQARQMGLYAGKSMFLSAQNELNPDDATEIDLDFCFECFSHVTRFFGFKVVLLGLFNGQGLDKAKQHLLIRCTKNLEYIKLVLEDWRLQGAILIGDTGLEETFENLILNQVDLSSYGEDLLNPDIDIEDYFD